MKAILRFLAFTCATLVLTLPLSAQDGDVTVISVLLPDAIVQFRPVRDVLDEFEADNPGIQVEIITDSSFAASPQRTDDLDGYVSTIRSRVTKADVVTVNSLWLLPEATQAGYLLDLSPLIAADSDALDADRFYANSLDVFAWDGSVWGIPDTIDLTGILYDPAAFDAAGLRYPDASWTLSDFEMAARALTLETPGAGFADVAAFQTFARAVTGQDFYQADDLAGLATFDDPATLAFMETLIDLRRDGALELPSIFNTISQFPMAVARSAQRISADGYQFAPLSDNSAGLSASGYAISRGTDYPDASYRLIKFLSDHPGLSGLDQPLPAQIDLTTTYTSPASQAGVVSALESITGTIYHPGEMRYANYLTGIIGDATPDDFDTSFALATLQADLNDSLVTLRGAADRVELTVDTPPARPDPNSSEIVVNFGVISSITPLPTRSLWNNAAREFVEATPGIDAITIETPSEFIVSESNPGVDCFYSPRNLLSRIDVSRLLSLDPFIQSDATYDAGNYVGDVLQQVTINDRVYAVPVSLQPEVLWLNTVLFEERNTPFPSLDLWDTTIFTQTIADLQSGGEDDDLISVYNFSGTHLLMLIAAYGGLPVDYSTDPPTINFTDDATVEAIRQVLDLARNDLMDYESLFPFPDSGSGVTPLIVAAMDDSNSRNGRLVTMSSTVPRGDVTGAYQPFPYPDGVDYVPVAYDVGAGYIFADTPHRQLCYDFIRFAASRPETFNGMPAERSLMDSDLYGATRTPQQIALYQTIADRLSDPRAIEIPTRSIILDRWLFIAFDNYVLNGTELQPALEDAQQQTLAYQQCVADIPPADSAGQTSSDYSSQIRSCADR